MRKTTVLPLLFLLLLSWTGGASGAPLLNAIPGGGYYDTFPDGSSYGMYTNSGDWLFTEAGNNLGPEDRLEYVEGLVREALGFGPDFVLAITDPSSVNWQAYDNNTGTWEVTPTVGTISFYAVKANDAFAMYEVQPPESTGSWSTFDIWSSGLVNVGNEGLEISHFTGYNATPIPEPATLLLLGTGIVGVAGFSRRKLRRA